MNRAWWFAVTVLSVSVAAAKDPMVLAPPPNQPPKVRSDAQLVPASAGESSPLNLAAQRALLQQKVAELDRLQSEIGELRRVTRTPQQILVRFQVLELARTKMRELGVDFATLKSANADDKARPYTSLESKELGLQAFDEYSALPSFLEALKQKNLVRVLAEPNVVTLSGRPASFHVGGEIPAPAIPGANSAVDYLKFGTEVNVVTDALGADQVRLELKIRVSEPDYGYTTIIEGRRMPLLKVRQCKTATTVSFGQSAVLGGAISVRTEARETEAGRINEKVEIELLFIATPELVDVTVDRRAVLR